MRFQISEFRFQIGVATIAAAIGAMILFLAARPHAQATPRQPDWKALEPEMMQQFQAVLRFDTRNPPGNEHLVADYVKGVFDKAGIPAQIFALDANRSNVVARLKGNGKKKPILILGHSDVVTVDEAKWKFPPFSATRDGGWVYARGTVDDKDNLTGGLMTMLLLKRYNVPLDRDVIFMSEAGEEGSSNFGMQFMVNQHYPEIESEYCLAEGGGAIRIGGVAKYTTVETLEKIPRGIELVAHGISGHGSIPLKSNAIVHLAGAVAASASGVPKSVSTRRPAPISAALPRSPRLKTRSTTAMCCRPIPSCVRPPTSGSSRTSRSTRRCCGRRCRPTSSPAAIART